MTEIQTTYGYKHLASSKSLSLPGQNQEVLLGCNTINVRRHDLLTENAEHTPQNQVIYSGTLCFEPVVSRTRHFKATYRVFAQSCEYGHIYMTNKATWQNSATDRIYGTPYEAATGLFETCKVNEFAERPRLQERSRFLGCIHRPNNTPNAP